MSQPHNYPQSEAEHAESRPLAGLGLAHRFELVAAPGRRALQGRMGTVRTVLIVLGLVTVGIVAYAEWLVFQPNPYPAATLAALNLIHYEEAFATATMVPSMPPPTEVPTPTNSPTPRPTNTLVPLPTGRPKVQPRVTELPSSPTPVPAPRLVAPVDGVTALDTMVFQWAWEGLPLEDDQVFDLRIWSVQEEESGSPRRGVAPLTKDTQLQVSMRSVPAVLDYGPGEYLWTVVIMELGADGSYKVIGAWGESRRLVYR